jgi:hypothetical protein
MIHEQRDLLKTCGNKPKFLSSNYRQLMENAAENWKRLTAGAFCQVYHFVGINKMMRKNYRVPGS